MEGQALKNFMIKEFEWLKCVRVLVFMVCEKVKRIVKSSERIYFDVLRYQVLGYGRDEKGWALEDPWLAVIRKLYLTVPR